MFKSGTIGHICFDLDGTLVDSCKTIYRAASASLEKLKMGVNIPEEQFRGMIGMHFIDIFNYLEIKIPDFQEFISVYKSIYFHYMDSSVLYPGAEQTLEYLNERRIKTSVLTTKAQDQAEKIIQHFKLSGSFSYVMGRRDGMAHKPSPEPLLKICDQLKIFPSNTLMIGDTELDIQCGKNANAKTCGVLYGYRNKAQIEREKPDYIISRLDELKFILD